MRPSERCVSVRDILGRREWLLVEHDFLAVRQDKTYLPVGVVQVDRERQLVLVEFPHVHVTAPTIHAGFGATSEDPDFVGHPIPLEIWNTGPLPVVLRPGLSICQLIFEWVDGTPEQGYSGQFAVPGPEILPAQPASPPRARKRRRR